MRVGFRSRIGIAAWLQTNVFALSLLCGLGFGDAAYAGPLITDGTFVATSLTSPGGFICQNGAGVGSTCTSNLTDWKSNCSTHGCTGTSTPGSVLFAGTTDADVSAWNGGMGLYPTVLNAPTGGNVIAIDGDSNYSNSIFQTVSGLYVGGTYSLTFYQGAAQQEGLTGATTEQWKVTLGTQTDTSTLMNNASEGVVAWNEQTLTFTATATSEVLTFLAVGTTSGAPPLLLLDDVGLQYAPEPGALSLLGVGAALVGLLARRKRQKV